MHQATPVPVKATDDYPIHSRANGLAAAAEPYDSEAKVQTFGSTKLPNRFTPILLVIENGTPDKLHLHRSNVKLACADGQTLDALSAHAMYEQLRDDPSDGTVAWYGTARHAYILENNDRKKTDWVVKEFPAETILTQGRRTAGFLYFRGKCSSRSERRLHLTADPLTSAEAVQLILDLK